MDGQRSTLLQALESMPIPNPKCARQINKAGHPMCVCTWMIDLDGVRNDRAATALRDLEERERAIERLKAIGIQVKR